jgi:hypothetical protein
MKGQDKIITTDNDTIYCRILSVSPAHIHYEKKTDDQSVIGKFILVEKVMEYHRSSQARSVGVYYSERPVTPPPSKRWLIGIQAGGSSLLASTSKDENEMIYSMGISVSQAKDFYKRLKRGFYAGGDVHYLLSNVFGIGVNYSFFTSSVNMDLLLKSNTTSLPVYATLYCKERLYINYAGPSALIQRNMDEKRKFFLRGMISVGYVHYRDEVRLLLPVAATAGYDSRRQNALTTGKTWGASVGLAVEYYPITWLSVGVNAYLLYSELNDLEAKLNNNPTVSVNETQNLSRLDYSAFVRFRF